MRFLRLYAPIIFIVIVALGWLWVSSFNNFYLSILFPLYAAILLSGYGILKYQYRDLANHSHEVLRVTLATSLKFFSFEVVVCIFILFSSIAWELSLILILFVMVHAVRIFTLWRFQSR